MTNPHDFRPRYMQAADELRECIRSGRLAPGEPVPSEPDLAERFAISRTSVRHAIQLLRDEGLVRTEHGRGTYVRAPRKHIRSPRTARYQWEKERALLDDAERAQTGATEHDTGLAIGDLKFSADYAPVDAPPGIAERFGVPPGTRLLCRTYETSVTREKVPLSIARSYLIYDMAAGNPALLDDANEPWAGGTMHQLRTIGVEIDRITDEITARPPTPGEAQILDIERGVSVIVLCKISADITGRVVEFSEVVFPGDRTEIVYDIQLARWAN